MTTRRYTLPGTAQVVVPATGHVHRWADGLKAKARGVPGLSTPLTTVPYEDLRVGTRQLVALDCPACAPALDAAGWAADPALVPLTPDEQRLAQQREQEQHRYAGELAAAIARQARQGG